ncbi:O-antigen ligase family protein [Micromonospora ureilytica]|uniref:O-antigen ligase family protein n=1 Tax=Micromonospora ureilytica TaxID=709868 RepID=UPI002E13CE05|nr:O-antigen ligase family protein [Micromonospora ureilytica]
MAEVTAVLPDRNGLRTLTPSSTGTRATTGRDAARHPGGARRAPRDLRFSGRHVPGLVLVCAIAFSAQWATSATNRYGAATALVAILVSCRAPRLDLPDLLAAALGLWTCVTLLWPADLEAAIPMAYLYGAACAMFIAVRHIVRTRAALFAVGYAFLAGCVSTSIKLISNPIPNSTQARDTVMDFSIRYGIEGVNYNYTAYSLAAGVALAAVLMLLGPATKIEWLCLLAAAAVLFWGVLLTGTRGALISVLVGAGYLLLSTVAARLARAMAVVVVPIVLIGVPLGLYRVLSSEMLWLDGAFAGRETGDLSGRLYIWPYAVSSWGESPLLGIGPGMLTATGRLGIGAHNLLLSVGNDLGLVGVLLYAGILTFALAIPFRHTVGGCVRAAGVFLVSQTPIWLTGHWEASPVCFVALALVSVAPVAFRPSGLPAPAPRS